jgi:D-alanine-D-alanine ligase
MIWLMHGLPTPRYAVLDDSSDLAKVAADWACR